MRPAIYGSQLVFNKQGVFVGYNIGYNFYSEHEGGTLEMVNSLNNDHTVIIKNIETTRESFTMVNLKYKRALKEEEMTLSKFKNTPFYCYVLSPNTAILVRNITIDNTKIHNSYNKFLTYDGEYIMVYVAKDRYISSWKEYYGKRRVFNESELLYMQDYNSLILSRGSRMQNISNIAGQWASDGFMLLIRRSANEFKGDVIADDIVSAIKRGCLAVVPNESRLFMDRGCCLIILDRLL